jgi:hypothetical protein
MLSTSDTYHGGIKMRKIVTMLNTKRHIVFALFAVAVIAVPVSAQWTLSGNQVFSNAGVTYVGIGTTNPNPNALSIIQSGNVFFGVKSTGAIAAFLMDRGTSANAASLNFRTAGVDNWIMGMGAYAAGTNFQIGNAAVPFLTLTTAGNLSVTGSITGASVIGAVYQDVAEWVPAASKMSPGTVVVLNPDANNTVMPSAHAYDTMVAGVVSAQPGILLGKAGDDKAQIATTGRVKVMVDASKGAIKVGDLLVTSDESGVAMKSQPMDIGGHKFHQPGTILGKALEPMTSGRGEILVLLSLQ